MMTLDDAAFETTIFPRSRRVGITQIGEAALIF
jgi:hypothetical protein